MLNLSEINEFMKEIVLFINIEPQSAYLCVALQVVILQNADR